MQERKPPKRLIITAGDARVGKSTISRLLLELYCELNLKCLAYYNGSRNKLAAYDLLVPVGELTLDRGGADRLLIDLERCFDIDVVVTDLPGQILNSFKDFTRETLLFDAVKILGYRITFVHPISHRKNCADYLQALIDFCQNQADYLVVKNHYFREDFPYYYNSQVSKQIDAIGGIEVCLGSLWTTTYESAEASGLPYSEVISNSEANLIERSQIFNWMEQFKQQLYESGAAAILGLSRDTIISNFSTGDF